MAFTYDSSALDDSINRIRLEIGDIDEDRPLLQDEEIGQIVDEWSTFNQRVAACCRLICSIFAGEPDRYRIENFTETLEKVFDRYEKMAQRYEAMASSGPWAGSIDVDYKAAIEEDTTLVHTSFSRGMHNNET